MAIRPRPPRAWVLLRDRYGGHVLEPTEAQRADALRELFHARADEVEHDECSLEHGRDGGPVVVVVFTVSRGARIEEWSSPEDCVETVLTRVRQSSQVTDAEAQELWDRLAAGDLEGVHAWRPG